MELTLLGHLKMNINIWNAYCGYKLVLLPYLTQDVLNIQLAVCFGLPLCSKQLEVCQKTIEETLEYLNHYVYNHFIKTVIVSACRCWFLVQGPFDL